MAKDKKELTYGKRGELVWRNKDGSLIRGLRRRHFVAKNAAKERVSEYYTYLSAVYKEKAEEALNVMTPEEKIDAQIAKLQAKKNALKEGK